MAVPTNDKGVIDVFHMYFAMYQQQTIDSNLLHSQYHTSLNGQDMTVSLTNSQDQFTSH